MRRQPGKNIQKKLKNKFTAMDKLFPTPEYIEDAVQGIFPYTGDHKVNFVGKSIRPENNVISDIRVIFELWLRIPKDTCGLAQKTPA